MFNQNLSIMRKHLFKWMLLLVAFMVPGVTHAQLELTVNENGGNNNSYVPFYGLYADTYGAASECIIPSDYLSDMAGGTISEMKFYLTSPAQTAWSGTFQVYLGEVESTTPTGITGPEANTVVYEGQVDATGAELTITFDAPYEYNGGNLLIGSFVSVAGNYKSAYFQGVTQTSVTSWYRNGASAAGSGVSFMPTVTFTYALAGVQVCPKPNGLTVSPFAETAAFSWNLVEGVEGYEWLYTEAGQEPNWDEANSTGETSVEIEGLDPIHSYVAYVRSLCGFGNSDPRSIAFSTTAIATVVGDGWSDDFEGDLTWEFINGDFTNAWVLGTATSNGGEHSLYISNDGGESNAYTVSGATVVYAAKLLSFETGKYEFSYDWNGNGESTYDYLRVVLVPGSVELAASTSLPSGLSTTGVPANWIALDGGSKLNLATEWQSQSVAIDITAGNYYLVLAWRNDNSGGTQPPAAVDNVAITRIACDQDVTDLEVSDVTTNSANLSWNGGEASQWQVVYSTSNNFEDAMETIVDENNFNLTDLTDATIYYVKVRAYCGGEDFGAWSTVLQFPTACNPITEFPYSENFDNITVPSNSSPTTRTLPTCWYAINTTTYASYAAYPTIYYSSYTNYASSTPNCVRMYSYYSSYGNYDPQDQYLILPAMENLGGKTLEMNVRGNSATSTFWVGVMTDPLDTSTFAPIMEEAQGNLTTSYQAFAYTIPSDVEGNYLAIKIDAATSTRTSNGIYVDDISVSSCTKPANLEITYEGGTTATISWESDAAAWNISVNDEVMAVAENPYTLTDLQLGTTYEVMVQADCEGAVSGWTAPVSFTTDLCMAENRCLLTFELTDSYGDSWNGAAIRVIDVETGDVIAEMANENLDGASNTAELNTKTLAVCDGRDIKFAWKSGSYDGETSFVIKDINGEEIYSALGGFSDTVNYTVSCAVSSCRKPTELTMAGRSAHSLTVEWTENGEANEWVVAYKTPDEEEFVEAGSAFTNFTITNLAASQSYVVKVRPVCDDEAIKWSNATTFMTLPGNTMPANVTVAPITYDATVSWEAIITNERHESYDLYWATADVTAIPEQLEAPNYVSGITATSYQITGLEALTDYRVWVRDNCGNDGVSAWTTPVDFSTLGDCPAPVLTEDGITNVAAHTADVEWAGYEANNSYEVTYWTVAGFDGVADEFGGTSLPSGWENKSGLLSTVMDGGALGSSTKWYFGTANGVFDNHARINIYGSSCNGWLITPEMTVPENGVMNFDLALTAYSGSQAPAASTTGTDDRFVVLVYANDQWNILREWNNVDSAYIYNNIPNTGENVTIDISEYAGQNVKFAFYGESTTFNADNNLHIDNVAIGLPIAAGEPQTLLVDENQVTLTGLDPETVYQVQVTGLCANDSTNASAVITFITDVACPAPEETAVELGENGEVSLFVSSMLDEDAIYEYQYWSIDDEENVVTLEGEDYLSVVLPAGSYAWQVRSICGEDGYSEWTEGESFTICLPYEVTIETPFVMDLNAEEVDLSCWDSYGTGSWTVTSTTDGSYWFKNNGYTGDMYLVSQAIQLPESGEAILSFDEMYNYVDDYGQSSVYVVLEDGDVEDVEPFWTVDTTGLVDQVVESRELSLNEYLGQTIRVIFRYEGNNAHDWFVNNIMVAAEDAIVYYERTIIDTVCDEYELTNSNGDVLAVYTESGEYENIYEDSVYGMVHAVLNLTINYSTRNIDEQTACDAYTWPLNNMTYTESTDSAFFVFVNEQGCPNITELHLTLYHKEHSYTEVSSCGPYTWELTGATYNKSGMKFNKGTTAEGCQIRDTLVLTVVERWGSYTKVANCGPYTWDKTGQTYNKSGLKFFKDTADDGCPVRDTLELTIVERWGRYTEATSCGPYTWELNNTTYNNGGLKFNKSYADDGCEIRDTLNLIIVEVGGGSNVFVKNCGPYTWDVTGQTYNKSGEKIYTTVDSVDGCFHRDTLTLTIVDRWGSYTELNYCGPYTWEKTGQTYNKSGLKFYKDTAEDGCPVRDTLNLKIEDRFHSYTEVAHCGPYTWDLTGQTYNKSGMKFRKGTAENGCLIRDTLVLTVVDRWSSYTKVANCGPYTWDKTGQTYNKSGLKFYKSVAEDGCPIRDTLELTVVTKWSSHDTVVSCDAPYTWDKTGQTYKKTGMKFFKGTAADGCPIRDTLYVIIGQSEHSYNEVTSYGPYTWDLTGKTYNKSGLKFNKGTNADGCPVRDTLNLIVLEPNTGAESYEYEIAENESPIEAPETIEAAQLTSLNAVKVYPNPTTGRIQINVTEAEKVEVLDLVGRLVAVYENTNTLDLTNLADGTYTLRITMAEGVALRKVVKR